MYCPLFCLEIRGRWLGIDIFLIEFQDQYRFDHSGYTDTLYSCREILPRSISQCGFTVRNLWGENDKGKRVSGSEKAEILL